MHSLPKLVVLLVCHQGVTFLYINSREREKFPKFKQDLLFFMSHVPTTLISGEGKYAPQ
jgi:hypothetical protein